MSDKMVLTVVERIEKVWPAKDSGWIDIQLGSGKRVSTKKAAIANQARQFEGATAAVDYVEVVNGQYTNWYAERFRQPAQDEAPMSAAVENARQQFRQAESNGGSQDEFRRSKEEMRWTEALHIAATVAPLFKVTTVAELELLATQIEQTIKASA